MELLPQNSRQGQRTESASQLFVPVQEFTPRAQQDIDECAENLHRCNTNSQLCVNTVGSFHCRTSYRPPQRHCARGFQIDQQTNVCVGPKLKILTFDIFLDINECERGEYYCRDEEECVNSPGSYRCMFTSNNVVPGEQCPAGFRYNHTRTQCLGCVDLLRLWVAKESIGCSRRNHLFRSQAEFIVNNAGNQTQDPQNNIDECFEKIHVCNLASEACINEPGGYRCGAKSGHDKQPTTDAQKCPPGFREHPVTKSCVDVDECAENEESPCDSNQDCTNTQGGYTCSCKYGFLLDQTLQACVDNSTAVTSTFVDTCSKAGMSNLSQTEDNPSADRLNLAQGAQRNFHKAEDLVYILSVAGVHTRDV
uniref:EGF-like domain-containing protein n=1 Tax=Timema cristinae TaxID=61476 RepID=A0A7R9GUU9_TIMCR|nr:unnamed protein product [Timema cristinae]